LKRLERRQGLLGGLGGLLGGLGGVVGGLTNGLGLGGVTDGLGGVVGGLTNTLGLSGVTGPLLDPLIDNVGTGRRKKPTQIIVQQAPAGPSWGYPGAGSIGGWGAPALPPRPPAPSTGGSPWGSWFGGGGETAPAQPVSEKMDSATVSIRGTNIQCRAYPDDYNTDPTRSILLSEPSKIDAMCWSPSTPGTLRDDGSGDGGWLGTKSNCFIKVSEVEEVRPYRKILPQCQEVRHWIGTMMAQYSRKDCYYCTNLETCGSEDLGTPPYADLLCWTEGTQVSGNNTWFKNAGKSCYYPAAIFEPESFMGTRGARC
jgi:hypothetical protein